MAESFDCPHCDAFYSIMPTLVGRKVRCNRCKNVFQLQPDGIAIKVDVSAPTSSGESALEKSSPDAAQGVPVKKQRSHTAAIRKDTQRIQKMRSSLQDMANKAIEDIDKHDALEGLERKPQSQQSQRRKNQQSQGLKHISVVLTSQEGAERRRKTKKGIIASLAVAVLLYVLFAGPSPQQQALNDFAQLPPAQQREHPLRSQFYVDKLWYASSQDHKQVIITNINEAELLDDVRELSTDGALQYFAQLSKMTRMYQRHDFKGSEDEIALRRKLADDDEQFALERRLPDIWIAQQDKDLARDLWWQQGGSLRSEFELRAKLKDQNINHFATEEILSNVRSYVLDKEAAEILTQLFLAEDHHGQPSPWQEKLQAGTIPRKLYVQNFKGDNGMRLLDTGKEENFINGVAYRGKLLSCSLLEDVEWRILEVLLR